MLRGLIWLVLVCALAGCTPAQPFRGRIVGAGQVECPQAQAAALARCADVTPEVAPGAYELHFVEFDDQGWAYRRTGEAAAPSGGWSQTDNLMQRLSALLDDAAKNDLSIVLYVHGWKHNAKADDRDVDKFRQLLAATGTLERSRSKPRKVVGIFVGWRGKSADVPDALLNLTFWSRKTAALRVSHGSVQELFARLRAVRQHYNGPAESPDCAGADPTRKTTHCRIRTLMIGHSFGAWVLYSAVSGPLIEALNARRDLPDAGAQAQPVARLADMIVLVNPAFEASRYEPLHLAAMRYRPALQQAPLLVTVTSTADMATRVAFPLGRFFNTIFEHPVSSEQQEAAMKHTYGHLERYLTHRLSAAGGPACPGWTAPGAPDPARAADLQRNKEIEVAAARAFFRDYSAADGGLKPGWRRRFCGGTELSMLTGPEVENRNPNSLVWNVQTDASVIKDHHDILNPAFVEFVRQLYDDTSLRLSTGTP